MKKLLGFSVICLIIALSAGVVFAESVTISFWTLFTGGDKEFMDNMIDKFEAEHPDIKVEPLTAKWENFYDFFTTAIAGGNAPDVAIIHMNAIPGYAVLDALYPLDSWVADYNIDGSDFHEIPWKTSFSDGKQYAIPLDVHPLMLYYNKDLLREAGILEGDEEFTAPTEREEWIQIWSQIADKTGKYPFTYQVLGTAVYRDWFSLLHQNGGQLLTDDNKKAAFNTPEGIDALQFIVDIVRKYEFSPEDATSAQTMTMFTSGDTAMEGYGVWRTGAYLKADNIDLGTDIYPLFGKERAVWANSHVFVLPRQRKTDNAKINASMKLIDWMTKNTVMWAEAGHIPPRKSVINSAEYQAMPNRPMKDPQLLGMVRYAPAIVPILEIEGEITEEIQAALLGKKDAETALADAEVKVNRILARY